MPRAAAAIQTPRRPTNVTLAEPLLAEAKTQQWLAENRPAIKPWNEYVDRHGLPLPEFHQF